jgi:hypothetical protein
MFFLRICSCSIPGRERLLIERCPMNWATTILHVILSEAKNLADRVWLKMTVRPLAPSSLRRESYHSLGWGLHPHPSHGRGYNPCPSKGFSSLVLVTYPPLTQSFTQGQRQGSLPLPSGETKTPGRADAPVWGPPTGLQAVWASGITSSGSKEDRKPVNGCSG